MDLYAPPPGFVPSYTWANKPATYPTGQPIFISNIGVNGSHWWYDSIRWRPVNGSVILKTMNTTAAGITNVESQPFSCALPAGFLQVTDRLRVAWGEHRELITI